MEKKSLSILLMVLIGVGPNLEAFIRKPSGFAPVENNRFILPEFIETYNKDSILKDQEERISDEFSIPSELKDRVSFWFDIYTKYSATQEVVHHVDYPWIVYRVIDLTPILDGVENRWTKYHKAKKFANSQTKEVKDILKKLSKKKNFEKLNAKEQEIFDLLASIPGDRKKVIKNALNNVRTQVGQRDYVEKGMTASSLYLSEIEKIFAKSGLPLELTRLPFVESSFNVDAISKVGASGIWQVMPFIGKKFLIMNPVLDERNSPVKSAETAAFILKQNLKILKSWPLALTAYNHGTGSLLKGIKKTGSKDLNVLIEKYNVKSFGFASQNFYSSFLAILHAEKYNEKVFPKVTRFAPLSFRELKLTKSTKIKTIIEMAGMTREDFKKFNLDIKDIAYNKNYVLPKGYIVHIPEARLGTFLENHKDQRLTVLVNAKPKIAL